MAKNAAWPNQGLLTGPLLDTPGAKVVRVG